MARFIFDHCGVKTVPLNTRELHTELNSDSFSAVIFPGGDPGLYREELGATGIAALKEFIFAGGGCITICAGTTFAVEIGLLEARIVSVPGCGVYRLQNRRDHAIFRDYSENEGIATLRINGPYLQVFGDTQSLADYDPAGQFAAIISRTYERGRVIGFSIHPEGGLAWGGGNYNPYFYFDGRVNRTHHMLQNAISWVQRADSGKSPMILPECPMMK